MAKILNFFLRPYYRFRLEKFRSASNQKPLPIGEVKKLRSTILYNPAYNSSLFPPDKEIFSPARNIIDPEIKQLLVDKELGVWSLTANTFNYLISHLLEKQPSSIFEFGSGLSTLCLAALAYRITKIIGKRVNIYSIEQDVQIMDETKIMLESHGLIDWVTLVHSSLKTQSIMGEVIESYDLSPEVLKNLLGNDRIDFVLIDGPSGLPGCRLGTLPAVIMFMREKAQFFMDDALRESEIAIAEKWQHLPNVSIEGIVMVGKGLLVGTVNS